MNDPADTAHIVALYETLSTREVAERVGLTRKTVTKRLKDAGVELRAPGVPWNKRSDWSEERIERLKALVAQGLSFGEIGKMLGCSRNAALGKAYRLGFSQPVKPSAPKRPKRLPLVEQRMQARIFGATKVKPVRVAPPKPKVVKVTAEALATTEPQPGAAPAPKPELVDLSCACSLLDLKPTSCRFPIGDPLSSQFVFCGRERKVGYYCEAHDRLTHRPTDQQPKKKKDPTTDLVRSLRRWIAA